MIYVIGIGPGGIKYFTAEAVEAIHDCEFIAGYEKYIKLVQKYFPDKKFMSYSMRQELERCKDVLNIALDQKINIGLISGGDPDIYGMASPILELAKNFKELEIKIIPGLTAANTAAAILGAPLSNDFAVISLSDLLTSWDVIEKRIKAACEGDFVICFYNPGSNTRRENFKRACEIMLIHKNKNTPAGIVKNISREGQEFKITTLDEIKNYEPKMNETIIIGNSFSYIHDDKFITPRGYKI